MQIKNLKIVKNGSFNIIVYINKMVFENFKANSLQVLYYIVF